MAGMPVGRERELAAVEDFLHDPETGAAVLVLEGAPGIGKTTLLQAAIARGRDRAYRVLACRAVESEALLAFVSLGDLLEPLLDEAGERLPPVQRQALEAALTRVAPTEAFGQLAVSRSTLSLLRDLARSCPVLIAIDDVQWLDTSTRAILEFALRRLANARLRIMFAARTSSRPGRAILSPALPTRRLTLTAMSVEELGAMVFDRGGVTVPRPRLGELHAACQGNPYFALELARALRAQERPLAPGDPLPVPQDLAALLRARFAGLRPDVLDALLLTAASPQPTVSVIERAAAASGALAKAEAAGIIETDGVRIRFTHPLLASVLYGQASLDRQRNAHARLASMVADIDERAVHLARASSTPDPAVACELDAAAARAHRRGAPAAAAELEGHALRLTPDGLEDERFARTLRSAEYHLAAGDISQGRSLLEGLLALPRGGAERSVAALALGQVRYISDDVSAAHDLFEQAAANAGDDVALRAEAAQALAFTAMLGGDIPTALDHASSSLALAERLGRPRTLALACARVALTRLLSGQGMDEVLFERAVALEQGNLDEAPVEWLPSYAFAWACVIADHLPRARELYDALARAADDHADERFVTSVLFARSELETRSGNWGRATSLAAEAVTRARQSGLGTIHAWALHAQALADVHLGRVTAAREAAAEGRRVAERAGAIAPLTQITSTLGLLELSLGDAPAAHAHLGPLAELIASVGVAEPGVVRFMPNAIEALTALGELQRATELLVPFAARARRLDRASARAAADRCAALLAIARGDTTAARAALEQAFAQHARIDEPFELARTLYTQGWIERRAKRRGAAREALTRALALFDGLGAALWSEKAAAELARIPGRATSSSNGLSETERRVAELAAQGLMNKEIAARLGISVRTVEAHLSKTYSKLGIRSRVGLVSRIGSAEDRHALS